ncbi:MAG: AAA family ATPase [Patescibacteria group bacterium]
MIIGITGTNGAGKGTVVDYLVKQKGFKHFSVREFLIEEIKRRGLPIDRDHMRLVGNDLRKTHRPGYIAEELLTRAQQGGGDAIIESLRNVGEAQFMKSQGMLVWGVDADRKVRYGRVVLRGSHTDKVSFEQFVEQEEREMAQTAAHDMNIAGVMQMADVVLTNNGTQAELFAQVEEALQKA